MRVFKKIVMVILALLPIISFLLFAATNVGNTTGQSFKKFGNYFIQENSLGGHNLFAEKDTFFSEMVHTFTNGEYYYDVREGNGGVLYDFYRVPDGSLFDDLLTFAYNLQGVGFSAPVMIVFLYILYMVFVEMIMMVYEVFLFVPKKCREIFGG